MRYVGRTTRQLSSSSGYFLSIMKLFQALWTFALTFVDDAINDYSKPLPQTRFRGLISQFSQSHHPSQEVSKVDIPCYNGPENRRCWTPGFDIETNYEIKTPTTRHISRHYLIIDEGTFDKDGYEVSALLINGSYPGPALNANWGDLIEVTVQNNLDSGTSIHWHGVRQLRTFFEDGVPGGGLLDDC